MTGLEKRRWCQCAEQTVPVSQCDRCPAESFCEVAGHYEEPPLYPEGKLAGMTLDELRREIDRQASRQGALGDAEHIDDRAVEDTEARYRMVEAEIKRRQAPAENLPSTAGIDAAFRRATNP